MQDPVAGGGRNSRLHVRRIATILAFVVVAVIAATALWVRWHLVSSLPRLDGELLVAGLTAPVTIGRDSLGVPRIEAQNRLDASFALGFLHAQERFFEMDLQRRRAAGELAALFGRAVLSVDRDVRRHRFRAVAERVVASLPADQRAQCEAYARGVAAGLDQLASPPFEYTLLRAAPVEWRPEDTVLVIHTMFLELQDGIGESESSIGVLHAVLPESLAAFLDPPGSEWDAALDGSTFPPPAIPSPAGFDLRRAGAASTELPGSRDDFERGSNNWAVAPTHTADGRAWLAGDMHLTLGVPNIWYRASIAYPDPSAAGGRRIVSGITLPGTPAIVAGSNGDVAWAYTNSETDASDVVLLEPEPGAPQLYRTPDGPRAMQSIVERIAVHGERDDSLVVETSIWGPVMGRDPSGRQRVLRWTAHDSTAVDLSLLEMEQVLDVGSALALAPRCGIPAQNCVVADRHGHIGWTIMGRLPRRRHADSQRPQSWADGTCGWDGWLDPGAYPRLVDPPAGRIWTANARAVGGQDLAILGSAGYALGARAQQIRDDLLAQDKVTAADLLRIQLDDRAVFLERWRTLLLNALGPDAVASDPRRAEMRRAVEQWGGRAAVESAGYRIVRTFRNVLSDDILASLTAPCRSADPGFAISALTQREQPVWQLLEARPAHFLDRRYPSWDARILAAVDTTSAQLTRGGRTLASRTWGERNTVHIQHPLSRAAPVLGRWLDMPARPLPGDGNMPRVQYPAAGASQRMAVSPGAESQGYFHMPCGQSGHPLSPHYRDAQAAWADGRMTPFLPGRPLHTLVLRPAARP